MVAKGELNSLRILLTNDDGIQAEGIQVLARCLARLPDIHLYIVAPERERSASGHAITLHKPLRVQKMEMSTMVAGAWAVSGTPADCTKLGLGALVEAPVDLLISGINRGPNLGQDVYYSGTVSAAMEGALMGIPSLAMSLAGFEGLDFTFAGQMAQEMVKACVHKQLTPGTLLNINIPALPSEEIAGLAVTRLGLRKYQDTYVKRTDPRGQTYYWLAGELIDADDAENTDTDALHRNLVSLTPICLDLTNHALLEQTIEWMKHVCLPKSV